MKQILAILGLGSVLGLMSVVLGMKSILIFLGLIYIYYCWRDAEKGFWLTYFITLMLPINSNNKIISHFSLSIGGTSVNAIQLMTVILTLIIILQGNRFRKFSLKNFDIKVFILLVCSYAVYVFIGVSKGYDAFSDFKIYIVHILYFYITYKIVDCKEGIYKLMNMTLYALTTNTLWTILIYLTQKWDIWGLEYSGGRFGGNYLTLYIITISYIVFSLYNRTKKINIIVAIVSLIGSSIMMMLSQNRTNPVVLLVSCVLILLTSLSNKKSRRSRLSKVVLIGIVVAGLGFGVSELLNSESDFAQRFTSISKITEEQNVKTRLLTARYYYNVIIKKPLGNGFGTKMPFVDANGDFQYEDGFNVDNAYINVTRKAGVITLILYGLLVVSPIFSARKLYRKSSDKVYTAVKISYYMLLAAASMITSQTIHSYAVSCFMWVFISYMSVLKEEEKNKQISKMGETNEKCLNN